MFAVKSNRKVSIEKGKWQQVQSLEIPDNGLIVWLKEYGYVKLFRMQLKDQLRHYAVYLPNEEKFNQFDRAAFEIQHDKHWQIEQYHRAIKQVCNIEKFQVRGKQAVKNHLFASIFAYCQLQMMTFAKTISNCYQLKHHLFDSVIVSFVNLFSDGKKNLDPYFLTAVNA